MFKFPLSGFPPLRLYGNAEPIRRAFSPSLSRDGQRLLFNSELWKENATSYLDEELFELELITGALTRVTNESGNQYAWYAVHATDNEFVLQSNSTPSGKYDIFLQQNGVREPLHINDIGNQSNDKAPHWWKP